MILSPIYEAKYSHDADAEDEISEDAQESAQTDAEDDLDEYAKWAAEAAAKATSGEFPAAKSAAPKPHKPIPMPVPSALKPKKQD